VLGMIDDYEGVYYFLFSLSFDLREFILCFWGVKCF